MHNNNINGKLIKAIKKGNIDLVKSLINPENINSSNELGFTPLMVASSAGNLEIVILLLNAGANVNQMSNNHFSALILAINKKNLEVTQILLDYGANPDVNYPDQNISLLEYAIITTQLDIIESLLNKKRTLVNQKSSGATPLVFTSKLFLTTSEEYPEPTKKNTEKLTEIVYILINAGADVNIPDDDGKTPLIHAASLGRKNIVIAFIESGAQVDHIDNFGHTAAMYAVEYSHTNCLAFILRAGASVNINGQYLLDLHNLNNPGHAPLRRAEIFTKISEISIKKLFEEDLSQEDLRFYNRRLDPTLLDLPQPPRKIYINYAKDLTISFLFKLQKNIGKDNMSPQLLKLTNDKAEDLIKIITTNQEDSLSIYDWNLLNSNNFLHSIFPKLHNNAPLVAYSLYNSLPKELLPLIYEYLPARDVISIQWPLMKYGFKKFLDNSHIEPSKTLDILTMNSREMTEFFLNYIEPPISKAEEYSENIRIEYINIQTEDAHNVEQYSTHVQFQIGSGLATLVSPLLNYFDDILMQKYRDKPLHEYFYSHGVKNLITIVNSYSLSNILPSNAPIAYKMVLSNMMFDAETNECQISINYGLSIVGNLAYSLSSLVIAHRNKDFIQDSPITSGFLMQVAPSALNLAYHTCEQGVEFMYQNFLELVGNLLNSTD